MITSKWKGFGSNFTLVKEQVLDWLAWRTAALLSSANKVTCWHFTTWRVLVWRESQLLLSTMNTREDPISIPQSTLVRICERKVSQIFYKRDCSRFVRRFLQNLTSESKFVRGKSHKSSKIPGVMCPPSTGGSHAGGFVRRSSHKSAGPEYRPSTSRAIVRWITI